MFIVLYIILYMHGCSYSQVHKYLDSDTCFLLCFVLFCFLATKETAFVHAISAAGVMYALTKNCSMGDFDNCGCDESKTGKNGKLDLAQILLQKRY